MLKEEDIESWNEIFPDCKVEQKDFAEPTMVFLVKAFIKYLQQFGYDVNPPIQNYEFDLSSREHRLFLIKIVHHIDHIVGVQGKPTKSTDKYYSFTYLELIRPSPKKIAFIWGILLNYLYFFNMYKNEVFEQASEAIKARNELRERIQEAEQENQKRKIKAIKIKEEIAIFLESLPKATAELAKLKEQKVQQQEEINKLEDEQRDMKERIAELQLQKRELRHKIVPDTEAQELHLQLQKRKEKITEQNALEEKAKNSCKERSQNIKSMTALLKDIEEIKVMLPMRQMQIFRETDKLFLETKNKMITSQENRNAALEQIKLLQEESKLLEENCKVHEKLLEEKKKSANKNYAEIEKAIFENDKRIQNLKREEEHLDILLVEQLEIKSYLEKAINHLMYPLKK